MAVSSSDLALGLTKTAGSISTYGNDLSETLALITAGVELLPNQA